MRKIIFLFIIFNCSLVIANAQWVQSKGINCGLVESFSNNGNYFFAGAADYGVYISTDNGISWRQTNLKNGSVNSIKVLNNIIYAATDGGVNISSNNGISWSLSTGIVVKQLELIGSIFFAGTVNGLYKSTDFCSTWAPCGFNQYNNIIYSLYKNGNNIYCGIDSSLYVSSNYGQNWNRLKYFSSEHVWSISSNNNYLFVGTSNSSHGFYFTTNNGTNWTQSSFNHEVKVITLWNNNIFVGNTAGVFCSTNNGLSWSQTSINNKSVVSLSLMNNILFAGVAYDGVYYSSDNGLTWSQTNFSIMSIYSITSRNGYIFAGTFYAPVTETGVYISTNNGNDFFRSSLTSGRIYSIINNGSNLFASSDLISNIYLSTNNGFSWIPTTPFPVTSAHTYTLGSKDNYIFAGTDNGIFITSNNGVNWIQSQLNHTTYCFASNNNDIYAGTYYISGVYMSTNNGINWIQRGLDTLSVLSLTINGDNIFAGTQSGFYAGEGIYLSTNNGLNWVKTSFNNQHVRALISYNNIIFAGADSGVYLTTNNGINWLQKNLGFNYLYRIKSLWVANNFLFAGTLDNSIWRRSLTEIIGIHNISSEIPVNFSLSQNYPNPFNPKTKIKFDLMEEGRFKTQEVKLVIYDITGKEIQTLVNETMKPGSYEVTFDGSNLPSGVYFYKLTAGNYIESKKMILIK